MSRDVSVPRIVVQDDGDDVAASEGIDADVEADDDDDREADAVFQVVQRLRMGRSLSRSFGPGSARSVGLGLSLAGSD